MIAANTVEEIDCANFFDNIEDLLEDLDDHDVDFNTNSAAFPPIWSQHSDSLPSDAVVDPVLFPVNTADSALSPDLCVPYDDQMEWLSNFVDDSFSGAETLTINTSNSSPPSQFHISIAAAAAAPALTKKNLDYKDDDDKDYKDDDDKDYKDDDDK